jgi:hypothetical protein
VLQFFNDNPSRTHTDPTSYGDVVITTGATAVDYTREVSKSSSFEFNSTNNSSTPKIEGAKETGDYYFTGSLTRSNVDQHRTSYSNTTSFARFNSRRTVKRVKFTSEVTVNMLMQYLTPSFLDNVANMNAEDLVAKYGTHVLLDIRIGGNLQFDYNGALLKETDYNKKTEQVKTGLGFGLLRAVGININTDKSTTQINEITRATSNRNYALNYYGGTNSGTSITVDKDGNTSQSFNLASWEQSINANNAALVGIERALFLYNFISDPVKSAQVKAVIEKRIADSQIKIVSTIPFYRLFNPNTGRHFYTPNSSEAQMLTGLGFRIESSLGGILTTQLPGSVPLYRWFRRGGNLDDHFYTTSSSVPGYTAEGTVGYVFTNTSQNHLLIPIYQYFYPNWEHLFTTDYDELGPYNAGYNYEGIGFYLW